MSKVNFFKPEDFEGFGLLAGDRDGIAEFANAKLRMVHAGQLVSLRKEPAHKLSRCWRMCEMQM